MIKVNKGTRRCSGVNIVKFERIPHPFLVLLLDDLEQVNVCWIY